MKNKTNKQNNKSKLNEEDNKVPCNVNSYRHLINPKEGSAEIINFAQSLRRKNKPIDLKKIPNQAFNVYGQETIASKNIKKVGDYQLTMNQQQVEHCYKGKTVGHGVMTFSQSLRLYNNGFNTLKTNNSQQNIQNNEENNNNQNKNNLEEKEKRWNQYSKIYENFYVKYVNPINQVSQSNLEKLNSTNLKRGELPNRAQPRVNEKYKYYSGFDGRSNLQQYDSKLPCKNLSEYKFLLQSKQDLDKNSLGWVSQLRSSYTNEPLHRKTQDDKKNDKKNVKKN